MILTDANKNISKELKLLRAKRRWKDYLFVICLVAWPIMHFLVFWLYVNISSFMRVFQTYKPLRGEYVWAGTGELVKMFKDMVMGEDPALRRAMLNSVFSIIPGLFIILPLAFISAYAFFKHVPGERLFRILFYIPSMISVVVLTMCYKYMFDPRFGPISMLFEKVFKIEGLEWLNASSQDNKLVWPLIYLYCVWAGLGSNVILIGGAMQRIPKEISESAKLDGIGFWREAGSIVLPLIMPTVTNFIVLAIMGMFGFLLQPMLLAGEGVGGKTLTIAMFVYNRVNSGYEAQAKSAVTAGMMFSMMFGPFVILTKIILDKVTPKVEF